MYHEFYNLTMLPFENTPDPRFFYASEQHREALAAAEYTIRMRKGFVLITGEIGSGKTTVGRMMCERCRSLATIVQVTHGHQSRCGLIRQLLRSLHVPMRKSDDHARMLERLQEHLHEKLEDNALIVVFVDEAQTLSDDAMEELRLLSNFDTNTAKLVQVVMVGQPELRRRMRDPRHAALRQRIVMSKQLRPLNVQETADYIEHRLRTASKDAENVHVRFDGKAIEPVHAATGGVPRLINVVCDNCLVLSYVQESSVVDADMVRRVRADMVPSFDDIPSIERGEHGLTLAA